MEDREGSEGAVLDPLMDRKERYTSFPRIPVQTPVRCVEGRTCSLLLSHVGPARVPSSSRPPHLDPIYKTCSVWVLSHRPCEFMHCLEPAPASVLYRLQAAGCRFRPGVPCGELEAGPESQPARRVRHSPCSRWLDMVSCPTTHLLHVPGARSRAATSHLWGRE